MLGGVVVTFCVFLSLIYFFMFGSLQTSSDTDCEPEQKKRRRKTSTSSPSSSTIPGPSAVENGEFTKGGTASNGSDTLPPDAAPPAWHDETVADIDPPRPPFKPTRTPGPQGNMTATSTPLELFQLFFSPQVLNTILQHTNAYGAMRQPGLEVWHSLLLEDLYAFTAIIMYMGLFKCPTLQDYWRTSAIIANVLPSQIMSRGKFLNILSVLHLSDPKVDAENEEKRGTRGYDHLCKIRPLYNQMVQACKSYFHPFQSISVHEKSNARSGLTQYMKTKSTKLGCKLFVLADCSCGYAWNCFVHEGKVVGEQGKGLSYESVMKLVDHKVLGTGYKLFVDNFHSSPTLFNDLFKKKILACGTMRSNRAGFPKTQVNSMPRHPSRGTMRWLREEHLLFVCWMDTQEVVMCSTMHKAFDGDTVMRRVKGLTRKRTSKSVPIPAAVKEYNRSRAGVDISDTHISFYNSVLKIKKWYKIFFYHFLDIAVTNAFVLHTILANERQNKALTQKAFREALVLQLLASSTPGLSASVPQTHKPMHYNQDSTHGRCRCIRCHQKTPVFCRTCKVSLCFVPKRDCFNIWHDLMKLGWRGFV